MKRLKIFSAIIAAALLAGLFALGGPADAQRQFSNFLTVLGGNVGVTPSIRAQGTDTNISINLVPKGSGTVQVAGVPVVTGGGTATSLTINPGPLNVTGTTNLTGPLFVQPGTATALKRVGARIFHTTTDAPTTGTVLETLYTFSLPANTLAADGESVRFQIYLTTAANANTKNVLVVFGATTIVTSGAQAFNNDFITITCDIFRTGAATQKAFCFFNASENGAFGSEVSEATGLTTPGETLSGAVTVLVRGTTATAAGDLTARAWSVDWYPVGQ